MDLPTDASAGSTAHHIHQASNISSSQSKPHNNSMSSAQTTAAASPFLLPIELLVEILRYLSTNEVARTAQVCRTWHAASKDVPIWRHLSFSPLSVVASPLLSDRVLQQVEVLSARCGSAMESVDFGHLQSTAVELLAKKLLICAPSIKHIYWKPTPAPYLEEYDRFANRADEVATQAVTDLARLCPQLETLELFAAQLYNLEGFVLCSTSRDPPSPARPRCFRLSVGQSVRPFSVNQGHATLFDHASTFELTYSAYTSQKPQASLMDSIQLFQVLMQAPAIERLVVHGLWNMVDHPFSVSALSLRYLDVRCSTSSSDSLSSGGSLHAPELRELTIDARLLHILTPRSTTMVTSLTLHVVSKNPAILPSGIERFDDYVGSLKLALGVNTLCAEEVLQLLSQRFLWPGLEEVEIKIVDASINDLVGVIAARKAGTVRGTSSEQYVEAIRKAGESLPQLRTCSVEHYLAKVEEVLATAGAMRHDTSERPPCLQVRWKIIDACYFSTSHEILKGIAKQPNVSVERF